MTGRYFWLIAALLMSPLTRAATPAITWSPKSIDRVMFPGLQLRKTISFLSSRPLSNVTLAITPALKPFVTITPSAFNNIVAGQSYPVNITISVPDSNPVQVLYKGTVHANQGNATLPANLKLNIEVEIAAAQTPDQSTLVRDASGAVFPVNEVILDLRDGVSRSDASILASRVGGSIIGLIPSINAYQVQLQTTSIAQLESAMAFLRTDTNVEDVFKNLGVTFFGVLSDLTNLRTCQSVNPTLLSLGKNLMAPFDKISIEPAWNLLQQQSPPLEQIRIGIVDSGINRNHQEYNNPIVDTGIQTVSSPSDSSGHGTAVSGLIGANNAAVQTVDCMNNASAFQMTGVLGGVPNLTYGLRVQGVNLIPQSQNAFEASFSASIDNLANAGVSVINISWGTYLAPATFFQEQMLAHPTVLFVMAAGNKGTDASSVVPASIQLSNTMTVAATDNNDQRAIFNSQVSPDCFFGLFDDCSSNFGAVVGIAAPGVDLWAPAFAPATYKLSHGTSFSAPMVTGAAAILKAIEGATPARALVPSQIKSILINSGDDIHTDQPIGSCLPDPSNPTSPYRCKRLNILHAVQQAFTPTFFDFALDSLTVVGNVNGGAGFADDFTGSILNLNCGLSTATVLNGFLLLTSRDGAFSTPDFLSDFCVLGIPNYTFLLGDGSGNSTITAAFRADTPLPKQFYGLELFTFGSAQGEVVAIEVGNFGGQPHVSAVAQSASFIPINLLGVDRIWLRLAFDDNTNDVTCSFSTDGNTFTTIPLSPPGRVMTPGIGSQAVVGVLGGVRLR